MRNPIYVLFYSCRILMPGLKSNQHSLKTNGMIMTNRARILIVENETPVAMMMVNALTRAGCEVLVAPTGKRGIELAQENKFNLIVLALDLTDISGFDIAGELKQRHQTRNTPIVFISDQAAIEDQQRALELGAADFIEKPFGEEFVSRLLSRIKQTEVTA